MLQEGKYISPHSIARWFLAHVDRDAGEAITHLKLQKLVYYAQAWFLANFDRPLFKEDLQAWAHGPVCRALYTKYKGCGWEALPAESRPKLPIEVQNFLQAIYDEYGQYSAKRLEQMTHDELPWKEARGDLPLEASSKEPISKLTMRNFYADRLGKEEIKTLSH